VSVLRKIYDDVREVNKYVKEVQTFGAADPHLLDTIPDQSDTEDEDSECAGPLLPQVVARLENQVSYLEVASITSDTERKNRVINIKLNDKDGISGEAKSFGMNSRHVEPLCYPVLFPHGESGWGEGIKDLVSFYQYLASRILQPEIMPSFETMQIYSAGANSRPVPVSRFQVAARVMSVYLVDMVSRSIDYRLQWMKKNQETIFGGTR